MHISTLRHGVVLYSMLVLLLESLTVNIKGESMKKVIGHDIGGLSTDISMKLYGGMIRL